MICPASAVARTCCVVDSGQSQETWKYPVSYCRTRKQTRDSRVCIFVDERPQGLNHIVFVHHCVASGYISGGAVGGTGAVCLQVEVGFDELLELR